MNKCLKCEQDMSDVRLSHINGIGPSRKSWKCIAYTCPHCSTVISVQMDPLALQTDTLNAVRAMLAAQPIRH